MVTAPRMVTFSATGLLLINMVGCILVEACVESSLHNCSQGIFQQKLTRAVEWKWRSNNKNQGRSFTSDTCLNGCCFEKEKGKQRTRGHSLPARSCPALSAQQQQITEDLPHPGFKIYKLGIGISLFVPSQFIWLLSKVLVCSRGDAFCCFHFEKFN